MNEQQIEKISHIASLILGDMQDRLTPAEQLELETWLQENSDNYKLYEELLDHEKLGNDLNEINNYNHQLAYEKLVKKIFTNEPPPKRLYFRIWWYMVAAVLLLVAGGVTYFALNNTEKPVLRAVVVAQKKSPGTAPDSKKAVLILGDGSTIALNEMKNGALAKEGNVIIQKNKNGQLEYKLTGTAPNSTTFNTIRTPRGGEYQVTLDDGSRIWLNSASTIQFPVHFNSNERRVILTGEAYFEVQSSVMPNTGFKKSFIVSVDNMEVQAVGTSFNICAYKEDDRSQTTVVEGLVKVNRNSNTNLLTPGKKLVVKDTNVTVKDADIKQEIAWKNGDFVFSNTSLKMVMNKLTRWYDMDVAYDKGVPSLHFSGELQRAADINTMLQMLEYTGGINFTISNRIITVHPGKK